MILAVVALGIVAACALVWSGVLWGESRGASRARGELQSAIEQGMKAFDRDRARQRAAIVAAAKARAEGAAAAKASQKQADELLEEAKKWPGKSS